MTGERTLPDVPAENYWYQRHVIVYDWVAQRVAGKRVIDMACGEGYGTEIIARTAASVVGVDANPEAYEHARLKYVASNLRFERQLIEEFSEPADAIVFLQTIEHVEDPAGLLSHFRHLVPLAKGEVVISTPNLLTLAPPGAEKSDNPWHVKEYRPAEFKDLLQPLFRGVELLGLYHAGRLAGYTRVSDELLRNHQLIPQITPHDFQLRPADVPGLEGALDLIAVTHP
jgi:2-polyprenyl-3-methyl-5-hydroxy-6-metoxy-1,4-benzoquinol methylase